MTQRAESYPARLPRLQKIVFSYSVPKIVLCNKIELYPLIASPHNPHTLHMVIGEHRCAIFQEK